jgi:hypothetical protein
MSGGRRSEEEGREGKRRASRGESNAPDSEEKGSDGHVTAAQIAAGTVERNTKEIKEREGEEEGEEEEKERRDDSSRLASGGSQIL